MLSEIVTLVTESRKNADELAKLESQIRYLTSKIRLFKDRAQGETDWANSATMAFRNAVPDILTLKMFDAPEYDRYNEKYCIYNGNQLGMIKSFEKINSKLAEIEEMNAEIASMEAQLENLNSKRKTLVDTLTEAMQKIKTLVPKLEPMYKVIEPTQKKKQAACDAELKELKEKLAKEYPADVVKSAHFKKIETKVCSCVGNLILNTLGNFQRENPMPKMGDPGTILAIPSYVR